MDRHLSSLVNIAYRVYKSRNDIFFRLVFEVKYLKFMRHIRVNSHFKVKDQINTVNMWLLHPNYVTLTYTGPYVSFLSYFIFVYFIFMSLIVLYFLHSTSVLSFYIDVVLTLSITCYMVCSLCSQSYDIAIVAIIYHAHGWYQMRSHIVILLTLLQE